MDTSEAKVRKCLPKFTCLLDFLSSKGQSDSIPLHLTSPDFTRLHLSHRGSIAAGETRLELPRATESSARKEEISRLRNKESYLIFWPLSDFSCVHLAVNLLQWFLRS